MARYNAKYCFLISKLTVETDVPFPCQASGLGPVGESFDLNQWTQDFQLMGDFIAVFLEENRESILVVIIYALKLLTVSRNTYQ